MKKIPNWMIAIGIGLLLVIGVVVSFFVFSNSSQGTITLKNYNKLTPGMKKEKVFNIINEENCTIAGYTTEGEKTTAAYSCVNSDGSNIQIVFENDQLLRADQFGLEE